MAEILAGDPFEAVQKTPAVHYRDFEPAKFYFEADGPGPRPGYPIRVDVMENFGPRAGEWRRTFPPIRRGLEDLPEVRIVDGWKDNSP